MVPVDYDPASGVQYWASMERQYLVLERDGHTLVIHPRVFPELDLALKYIVDHNRVLTALGKTSDVWVLPAEFTTIIPVGRPKPVGGATTRATDEESPGPANR